MDTRPDEQRPNRSRRSVSLGPRWLIVTILILSSLLLAILLGNDYGMSVDEPDNSYVGELAVDSYKSRRAYDLYMLRGVEIAHHGPSYFMPWQAGSRLVIRLLPGWHIADGHHFINSLVFLVGLVLVYRFSLRLMKRRYALMMTFFIGTQPLLFGHAFINQKDSPFWVLLLASIVAGMAAVDWAHDRAGRGENSDAGSLRKVIRRGWQTSSGLARYAGVVLVCLGVAAAIDILTFELGYHFAEQVIRLAHRQEAWPLIKQAYRVFAEDADKVGVEVYLSKLQFTYWILRAPLLLLSLALAALGVRMSVPALWQWSRDRFAAAGLRFAGAGAILGFTLSLRPIAGLAAGLVGLYWLLRYRLRFFGLVIPYVLSAGLLSYLTWPFLWDAPYARFLESLLFTGNIVKETLYWGRILSSDSLPWHYFPSLFATELTEPTLPLVLIGLGTIVTLWLRRRELQPVLTVLLTWIALPLVGLIGFGMGVYGNLRHLLFVVVPLLVVAGLGLQWVMDRLPSDGLRIALFVLLVSPGVLGLIRLHPYQYIYFNSYIGGVEQAAGLHILDRWCISYREAMDYVNRHARPSAVVASKSGQTVAGPFAREDLEVVRWNPPERGIPDYMLSCGLRIGDLDGDAAWEKVYSVERAGAVLAEVHRWTGAPAQDG